MPDPPVFLEQAQDHDDEAEDVRPSTPALEVQPPEDAKEHEVEPPFVRALEHRALLRRPKCLEANLPNPSEPPEADGTVTELDRKVEEPLQPLR